MNFCLCWISFFRSSQFIRLITSVLVKLLSYRSFNGTACSLRAPAVLDRILRTMAVAALHDNCSRDTVRGTGPHHLGLLHRHCFHDMEQKQADDAGPKQTTVAQWVFWILKMHLNYFWITTHSTFVLWRSQWHFFTAQRSDAVMLDVGLILFQKTDCVVNILRKWIKVESKLTDKISLIIS